jgi:hypothetical protein
MRTTPHHCRCGKFVKRGLTACAIHAAEDALDATWTQPELVASHRDWTVLGIALERIDATPTLRCEILPARRAVVDSVTTSESISYRPRLSALLTYAAILIPAALYALHLTH